ncbi:MAG: hypothetical protein KGJ86_00100 [Chloroflexota bacterium]|nr:hypothetical protein [Chloroflexota bacterium]
MLWNGPFGFDYTSVQSTLAVVVQVAAIGWVVAVGVGWVGDLWRRLKRAGRESK